MSECVGGGGGGESLVYLTALPIPLSHNTQYSIADLNIEDIIPSTASSHPSSTYPLVALTTHTPTSLTHVPITTLTNSPRNSRSFSMPTELTKSMRSLQSFKELFVHRKRISIGQVLKEGEVEGGRRERGEGEDVSVRGSIVMVAQLCTEITLGWLSNCRCVWSDV